MIMTFEKLLLFFRYDIHFQTILNFLLRDMINSHEIFWYFFFELHFNWLYRFFFFDYWYFFYFNYTTFLLFSWTLIMLAICAISDTFSSWILAGKTTIFHSLQVAIVCNFSFRFVKNKLQVWENRGKIFFSIFTLRYIFSAFLISFTLRLCPSKFSINFRQFSHSRLIIILHTCYVHSRRLKLIDNINLLFTSRICSALYVIRYCRIRLDFN